MDAMKSCICAFASAQESLSSQLGSTAGLAASSACLVSTSVSVSMTDWIDSSCAPCRASRSASVLVMDARESCIFSFASAQESLSSQLGSTAGVAASSACLVSTSVSVSMTDWIDSSCAPCRASRSASVFVMDARESCIFSFASAQESLSSQLGSTAGLAASSACLASTSVSVSMTDWTDSSCAPCRVSRSARVFVMDVSS